MPGQGTAKPRPVCGAPACPLSRHPCHGQDTEPRRCLALHGCSGDQMDTQAGGVWQTLQPLPKPSRKPQLVALTEAPPGHHHCPP